MSRALAFTVLGQPVPAERPRIMNRRGAGGRMVPVALTPQRTLDAEARVASAFREAHPGHVPLAQPILLQVAFQRETRVWADLDNLLKVVMDGLNGVAWTDDRWVERIHAERVMGLAAGDGATYVSVLPLGTGETDTLVLHDDDEGK